MKYLDVWSTWILLWSNHRISPAKNNIKMHRKENLFPHYDSSKMRTIPYRTKVFIGINVCEIRDCQNRKTFRPTKTHLQQVLVAWKQHRWMINIQHVASHTGVRTCDLLIASPALYSWAIQLLSWGPKKYLGHPRNIKPVNIERTQQREFLCLVI